MGVNEDRAVRAYVSNGHAGADRRVLQVRHFVSRHEFLRRTGKRCCGVAPALLALRHRSRIPVRLAQLSEKIRAAGQALPIGPLGCRGDVLRGADGLPLGRRDDTHQVALDDHPGVREERLVDLARRNQLRAERLRVHHTAMQHARQTHVRDPLCLGGDLRRDDAIRVRLANDRVLTHRLHGRVTGHDETPEAREVARDRDYEIELLALDQFSIGDGLSAAGHNAVLDRELILRDAQSIGRELEQGLTCVGRRFADIRRAVPEKIESAAAIGRAVGIARDDRGDGFERNAELFGHDLAIGGERGALAKVVFPRADEEGVVRMDFDPGARERGIQRIAHFPGLGGRCAVAERRDADESESDKERAARLHQFAPRQLRAEDVDGGRALSIHALPPFAMLSAARMTPSRMAV